MKPTATKTRSSETRCNKTTTTGEDQLDTTKTFHSSDIKSAIKRKICISKCSQKQTNSFKTASQALRHSRKNCSSKLRSRWWINKSHSLSVWYFSHPSTENHISTELMKVFRHQKAQRVHSKKETARLTSPKSRDFGGTRPSAVKTCILRISEVVEGEQKWEVWQKKRK